MKSIIKSQTINILDILMLKKYSPYNLKSLNRVTGVYFLFKSGHLLNSMELIYVGKSTNLYKRLTAHKGNGKGVNYKFDYVSYVECDGICERALLEIAYICYYKPELNKQYLEATFF